MDVQRLLEAQAHREAYIALLNSALRLPGSKARFAQRVGISRVYLSYLLNPDVTYPASFRRAGPRVAERIAAAFPGDPELREALLEHMRLSGDAAKTGRQVAPVAREEVAGRVEALRLAHGDTLHRSDPATAGRTYRVVRDLSRETLEALPPLHDPLAYLELCFLLHDTACSLNRADEALFAAKRAQIALDRAETHSLRGPEFDGFRIQAYRAEAVAYHNLGLDREADWRSRAAEASAAWRRAPGIHGLHVYGDRVSALRGMPRASLGEAKELTRAALASFERYGGPLGPLWMLLIRRSLALAYLQHGNRKEAGAILRALLEEADHTPLLGALHQTMLLVAYARYLHEEGSAEEMLETVRAALAIAVPAHLTHQVGHLRATFGEMVDRAVEELS